MIFLKHRILSTVSTIPKGIYLLMVSYIFVYLPGVASSSDTSYCPGYSFPVSYGTIYADNLRSVDFFFVALNDF